MFNGLTLRNLLLIGALIICVALSVGLDYSKRKIQRLTEQNRTLQVENRLFAEQQKNQAQQLQRYQQQVDQLSNALQQQKQHVVKCNEYFPFLYSTARCHHFVNAGTAI